MTGILAGYVKAPASRPLRGARLSVDDAGNKTKESIPILEISGMAPMCKLVSYKVLNEVGGGQASGITAALQDIGRVNDYGRNLRIHGVNLSVGYPFDPDWFACGHSAITVGANHRDSPHQYGVSFFSSKGPTGDGRVKPDLVAPRREDPGAGGRLPAGEG